MLLRPIALLQTWFQIYTTLVSLPILPVVTVNV